MIKNSTICWNYLYLSRLVDAARTPEERDRILKMVALHSPTALGYIILLGQYDLTKDSPKDNTGVLLPKTAHRIIPKTGSREIDDTLIIAGRKGVPFGGSGTYVGSRPSLDTPTALPNRLN